MKSTVSNPSDPDDPIRALVTMTYAEMHVALAYVAAMHPDVFREAAAHVRGE